MILQEWSSYTKPNVLVLMAVSSLFLSIALLEYSGKYNREIQVFAVGRCWSEGGRSVTLGGGW